MYNNLVTVSNTLINSSYSLDLIEKRLILGLVSKIRNEVFYDKSNTLVDKRADINTDTEYSISAGEYGNLYGLSLEYAKDELAEAVERLYSRDVEYLTPEGKIKTRWISTVAKYNKSEHTISLYWAKGIIPLISELQGNFTSYRLRFISQAKSIYSIRLYEIFIMELNRHKTNLLDIELKVEDLRRMFKLETKYKLFSDFMKSVIEEPVDKLNKDKFCNLSISYGAEGKAKYVKKGRKITAIRFTVERLRVSKDEIEKMQMQMYGQKLERTTSL